MNKNQTDKATARPWELDGFNDSGVWRVKSGKRIVAYLYPQMPKSDDEINADAALIVRAVNEHAALLAVAEAADTTLTRIGTVAFTLAVEDLTKALSTLHKLRARM